MRVYVASSFMRANDVSDVMIRLRKEGHSITVDWTKQSVDGMTNSLLVRRLQDIAAVDAEGVRHADAFVMLHDERARGANTELGMALAYGKLIVIVNGLGAAPSRGSLFYLHPGVLHVESVDKVVEVLEWAEREFANPVPDMKECACSPTDSGGTSFTRSKGSASTTPSGT